MRSFLDKLRNASLTNYGARVRNELASYAAVRPELALPGIFTYWATRHLSPRVIEVMGTPIIEQIHANALGERLQRGTTGRRIASLGCGDCSTEIDVARRLVAAGITEFTFECYDLSPFTLERAQSAVDAADLTHLFQMRVADVNAISLKKSAYAGIMVSHALHHLVELERVFDQIWTGLADEGVFVCGDMIGRNGHMRWPEAEAILRQVWAFLPREVKYNHLAHRQDDEFLNWDCSADSFEGIRAQDILPLLVKKFHFERFVAFGNLPDTLVERTYGPNLSVDNPRDTGLIDFLEELNTTMIHAGLLKPTQMLAVMGKQQVKVMCDRGWTPEFCVRDPRVETLLPTAPMSR